MGRPAGAWEAGWELEQTYEMVSAASGPSCDGCVCWAGCREMADNAIHATGGGGSGVAAAPAGAGAAAPMFTPEMAAAAASSDPTEQMRVSKSCILLALLLHSTEP